MFSLMLTTALLVLGLGAAVNLEFPSGVTLETDTEDDGWLSKLSAAIKKHVSEVTASLQAGFDAEKAPLEKGRATLREYLTSDLLRMEGLAQGKGFDAAKRRTFLEALGDPFLAQLHEEAQARFAVRKAALTGDKPAHERGDLMSPEENEFAPVQAAA